MLAALIPVLAGLPRDDRVGENGPPACAAAAATGVLLLLALLLLSLVAAGYIRST